MRKSKALATKRPQACEPVRAYTLFVVIVLLAHSKARPNLSAVTQAAEIHQKEVIVTGLRGVGTQRSQVTRSQHNKHPVLDLDGYALDHTGSQF